MLRIGPLLSLYLLLSSAVAMGERFTVVERVLLQATLLSDGRKSELQLRQDGREQSVPSVPIVVTIEGKEVVTLINPKGLTRIPLETEGVNPSVRIRR